MSEDKLRRALSLLSGPSLYVNLDGIRQLEGLGEDVPKTLLKHYRQSRGWRARLSCVYFAVPYARTNDDVAKLGIEALNDKPRKVRYRACSLLAYSLREDVLTYLRSMLNHDDSITVADVRAAIECIEAKNHHWFMDRGHTGRVKWTVE